MYNDIERVYPHQLYQRACYLNINWRGVYMYMNKKIED